MEDKLMNIIAWEEGDPAQTILAPEQTIVSVVSSYQGQVYFLTEDGRVYLSTLRQESTGLSGKLQELALPCQCVVSLSCNLSHVLFISDRGRVLRSELVTPEKVEELPVQKPRMCCQHGMWEDGERLVVREVASTSEHVLFVSDSGHIWLLNEAQSKYPELVQAFRDKSALSIHCGNDYIIVLVQDQLSNWKTPTVEKDTNKRRSSSLSRSKQNRDFLGNNLSLEDCVDGEVLIASCIQCREQSMHKSAPSINSEQKTETNFEQISSEDPKEDSSSLAQVCWSKADSLVRQSALFLNSDAAKQFLTRQLSWVTGSTEIDDDSGAVLKEETKDALKDNVTQVAHLVVESVKNFGGKVNRMSRHWSGTSQEEIPECSQVMEDHLETHSLQSWDRGSTSITADNSPVPTRLPRQIFDRKSHWRRNGTSSLSLDSFVQNFANRPWKTDEQTAVKTEQICLAGQCLLATSVWTWGQGRQGQLGHSDCVARDCPTLVRCLNGIGVCKIAVGSFHCLALTIDGRVFAWGSNSKGQICPSDNQPFISTPREINLPYRATVKDIAAGGEHNLLLTTKAEVFFVGYSMATQKATLMRLNLPVSSPNTYSICQKIWASGSLSCCMQTGSVDYSEWIISEQLFLRSCLTVCETVFTNINLLSGDNLVIETRQQLLEQYRNITSCVTLNIHSLLDAQSHSSVQNIAVIRWIDEYIQLFRSYCHSFCNALVINAFTLTKAESSALEKVWPGILEFFQEAKMKKTSNPFQVTMMEPVRRLKEYAYQFKKLADSSSSCKELQENRFAEAARCYEAAALDIETEYREAEYTKSFWESCSTKLAEALRTPQRRVLRESRSHPITVVNSGRFSSHWFILLTDVLVHVGYSGHVTYPLSTIWVEPLQDSPASQTRNCLAVTMPEDSLTLTCPTSADKLEWFKVLQSAIKQSLYNSNEDLSSNRISPPLARYATYTFTKLPSLKDTTYTGLWLCGKMHGEGELVWPDGRKYKGNFRQNLQYGFGTLETPSANGTSLYEGTWKEGKMNGYAILKYANGDVYEGYFQDNVPHGHGTLKRGHFLTSAAHVYVGQWECGQKHGYGVMDDIVAGEKYMGMWQADAKHGNAVLVTLDGLYMEGQFTNNKMTGPSVMLLEDGTAYEGEVGDVGVLGGKGILRLPNSDIIQGTFHGCWSEGVKVNGTLTKATVNASNATEKPTSPQPPNSLGQYSVPSDRKWEALFRQCYQVLSLPLFPSLWTSNETLKAWDSIAVAISQTKNHSKDRRSSIHIRKGPAKSCKAEFGGVTEIPEILQRIPDYGRGHLDLQEYRRIQAYIQKAFDSAVHPLGNLMNHLVDVYRATYVGVGAHARLLPHAVGEVRSFVNRIYTLIRLLFPALPTEDQPCMLSADGDEENKETVLVSAYSVLLPLLLPRLYPPLFTLYALNNEKQDDLYWDRLQKWNRQPDIALMTFLGVDTKFFCEEPNSTHFSGAIDCLQQLSTTFCPGEKLNVIQATFQEITKAVQSHLGTDYLWNMDDLFPVFQFVVVRSRIRHLGSEIQLMDDLIEHHIQFGELDIMFTTLKACYFHIQHEKMTFT